MAPTFYHYLPVPMAEKSEEQGRTARRWLSVGAVLALLLLVVLITLLIYFAARANSEACRDGLQAREECRNTTNLLQRQLTRSQDSLLQAETQAASCHRTVVTLQESLEKKVFQTQQQQAHIQELENEVMKLKKELENLRSQETSSTEQENSGSSMVVSSPLVLLVTMFLFF